MRFRRADALRRATLLVLALTTLAGCVSAGAKRPTGPRDPYLISTAELAESPHPSLYDAVRQLRPDWFRRARDGQPILVYLDDRPVGDISVLGSFSVGSVRRVRFLSVTEAQVRYGTPNRGRAAIQVITDDRS